MSPLERRITLFLASIYGFRMLGLFMILPVFSLYANDFQGATPTLIGLALGIYGLTQAILQIPFGMTSDRLGRKPVIVFGLILFLLGSVIAAESHSIYGIIAGRAMQGAGAIGSALIALLADSTAEEHRLKAMSLIGMTIGFSFIVAMCLGPILDGWIGLSGIFWLIAGCAALGILIILVFIPTPKSHPRHRDSEPVFSQFKKVLMMPELLRLDFGIFCLHAMLMALFIALPATLTMHLHFALDQQWKLYVPVLIVACVMMMPFVIVAEAKRLMKPFFVGGIILFVLTQILLGVFHDSVVVIGVILCFFFAAFTFLEASLPSLISKIVPVGSKGTAMGIYSSAQFLGVFFGGTVGGFMLGHFGMKALFVFFSALGLIWVVLAFTMKNPPYLSSRVIAIGSMSKAAAAALQVKFLALPGVKEVLICEDEGAAYLKVDKRIFVDQSVVL